MGLGGRYENGMGMDRFSASACMSSSVQDKVRTEVKGFVDREARGLRNNILSARPRLGRPTFHVTGSREGGAPISAR